MYAGFVDDPCGDGDSRARPRERDLKCASCSVEVERGARRHQEQVDRVVVIDDCQADAVQRGMHDVGVHDHATRRSGEVEHILLAASMPSSTRNGKPARAAVP
ncbi:hypothetical protein N868_13150 [Cellulomonas carbonis T26]|uniref:Uncharacterized protein n=1 Tax=Cellulomonas carbonis T26 TaxID=947969 RepID=A0A0A0BSK4_9CELL|nr:hypothetical protein N868_13150 [Cellulomonas carbonis T26]